MRKRGAVFLFLKTKISVFDFQSPIRNQQSQIKKKVYVTIERYTISYAVILNLKNMLKFTLEYKQDEISLKLEKEGKYVKSGKSARFANKNLEEVKEEVKNYLWREVEKWIYSKTIQ